jgi:hypothetical protein
MDAQYRKKLKADCRWIIGNTLDYGPVKYDPPDAKDAAEMGITLEEALAIYDEAFHSFRLTEIEPGLWNFKTA